MIYCVQYGNRPTFFLDGDIQGIMSFGHARRIAADVLGVDSETEWHKINVEEAERLTKVES